MPDNRISILPIELASLVGQLLLDVPEGGWSCESVDLTGRLSISVEALVDMLTNTRVDARHFRIYSDGRPESIDPWISMPGYRRERTAFLGGERIAELIGSNRTVVIDHLELLIHDLERARDLVETECRGWVHVNAYVAGGVAQGLPGHRDDHDVVVIQCDGSRRWILEANGSGQTETRLGPGEALLIGRGTAHAAYHDADCGPSLHLTFAIIRPRVVHTVSEALRRLALKSSTFSTDVTSETDVSLEGLIDAAIQELDQEMRRLLVDSADNLLHLRREQWMEGFRPDEGPLVPPFDRA